MGEFLLKNEASFRLISFFSVFLLMVIFEFLAPFRKPIEGKGKHYLRNLSMSFLSSFIARALIPILPISFAHIAQVKGWGFLNLFALSDLWNIILTLLIFDCAIYWQHVLTHRVPILWRLHMVHHTDLDFDTSTGIRFHPIEIFFSLFFKLGLIFLIGPSPVGVLLFEVTLNATALFNHSNFQLPKKIEPLIRYILVTPDLHRVHHSVITQETNSNYGFNFTLWDRLFRTYTPESQHGIQGVKIGLPEFPDRHKLSLLHILYLPFLSQRKIQIKEENNVSSQS